MDVLILVLFLLLRFSCASGFLIMLTPRKLCLLNHQQVVALGRCDITNPAQQWAWSGENRLMHTQSSLCLWADPNPRLPAHARLAYLRPCSAAPAWKCDSQKRTFGLAGAQMYLKKQGTRVVIRGNSQYSDWSQYEVDSGGNQLMKFLCPETGTTPVSTTLYLSTHKPLGITSHQNYAIKTPAITVTNERLSNTVKTHRTARQVTTTKIHSSITNEASLYVNDINKPRTRRSVTADFNPDVSSSSVTERSGFNSSHVYSSSPAAFTTDRSTEVLESASSARNVPEVGTEAKTPSGEQDVSTSTSSSSSSSSSVLSSSSSSVLSSS
ncbi:uncharacterized protein YMR317W-like, partial [Thunnus albacares]|uniref:uncharacterized protein YMR317W-like n=1 Tax=Thunnus albacares TaxID=8236 RepID=UPI001CF6C085